MYVRSFIHLTSLFLCQVRPHIGGLRRDRYAGNLLLEQVYSSASYSFMQTPRSLASPRIRGGRRAPARLPQREPALPSCGRPPDGRAQTLIIAAGV